MIEKNGKMIPGRLHGVILSDNDMMRSYRNYKGIYIDNNLKHVGDPIMALLHHYAVRYVSLLRDNIVEGRSWEMAACKSLLNDAGVYSGTVKQFSNGRIEYGIVPGIDIKRLVFGNVITANDVTDEALPR